MKRLLLPLAIAAALAFPGTASANAYTADADCDGLVFDMPRTEDGAQVFATRNGMVVADIRNDVFGAAVRFTVPSPDRSVAQVWRVSVIGHNGSYRWSETVAPCDVPTTTTVPATTTTTVPATTTTTTVPVTTTTVDVPPPPVPTSSTTTVVTTPRPTTTTTTVPPVWVLPETGQDMTLPTMVAVICVLAGGSFLYAVRRWDR